MQTEGEVTVRTFDPPVETQEEQPLETEQQEESQTEESVQEEEGVEPDPAAIQDNAGKSYTEAEMLEAMELAQRKLLEQLAVEKPKAEVEVKPEPVQEVRPIDDMANVLNSLFETVNEDDVITGKDFKDLMVKTFTTLANKGQETHSRAEQNLYQQGAEHYIKEYIPKVIKDYNLEFGSIEAEYVANSFIQSLAIAEREFGQTGLAAKKAAEHHLATMSQKLKGRRSAAPIVQKDPERLRVDQKLASGNTGKAPVKPAQQQDLQASVQKLQSGKMSTAELLRMVNNPKK